jgi:hypothetical protein
MSDTQKKTRTITIGNAAKDADLIARILQYQKEKNIPNAAATVRALCEDALDFKKAMR